MPKDRALRLAKGAGALFHLRAQGEQFAGIKTGEMEEFRTHAGSIPCQGTATPHSGVLSQASRLNKTETRTFHGVDPGGKSTVQTQSQ